MYLKYRGRRIRKSNKNLLFNVCFSGFLFIFLLTMFLFHCVDIFSFKWSDFSIFNISDCFKSLNYIYLIVSLIVSSIVGVIFLLLFFMLCKRYVLRLRHRQAIARMILENGWYEKDTYSDGFFSEKSKKQERISWFPKIYYKLKDNRIYISVKITMGKFQEQMLTLDKKIETGLFCEFIEFKKSEPYYDYMFYYNIADTRINISELEVYRGSVELMKGFAWNFNKLPHALIVGGTGSGKTYFLLALINVLVKSNAVLNILDPKNADLADLNNVMSGVYHKSFDIVACVKNFSSDMLKRSEEMKLMSNYKTGSNYSDLGLQPHFLIFDEYVAFFEMLSVKESNSILNDLKKIAMLGRQAGYFLILACQRADAKYLGDGIRDQFHFRVALGRNSELGYKMIFGDVDKKFMTMPTGRGYVDMGTNIITEFYVPYVPADYDFLKEIGKHTFKKPELPEDWESTTPEVFEDIKNENAEGIEKIL